MMQPAEFVAIDHQVLQLGRHACHLLLSLDPLRHSPDPALRSAYQEVHDLIGDVGALRLTITVMPHEQTSQKDGMDQISAGSCRPPTRNGALAGPG